MNKIMDVKLLPTQVQQGKLLKCCAWSRLVYNLGLGAVRKNCGIADWNTETLTGVITKTYGEDWSRGIPDGIVQGSLKYLSDVLSGNLGYTYWGNAYRSADGDESFMFIPTQDTVITSDSIVIPEVGSVKHSAGSPIELPKLEYVLVVYDFKHPTVWLAEMGIL